MILRKFMLVGTELIDNKRQRVEKQILMEDRHATNEWKARVLGNLNSKDKTNYQGNNLAAIGRNEGLQITEVGDYQLIDLGLVDNFGKQIIEELKKPTKKVKNEHTEETTELV